MTDPIYAYLLLDTSASMNGAPLEALKQGVQLLVGTFISRSKRPIQLAIIGYESTARELMPLADVHEFGTFEMPILDAAGSSGLGGAARLAAKLAANHTPTLLYIFTDGEPTDDWESALDTLRPGVHKIYGLLCGLIADLGSVPLTPKVDEVFRLQDLTPDKLFDTFRWLV
jgi:uncharacterized protein YegL